MLNKLKTKWKPPKLFESNVEERKVYWLELFYDLIYVAAIIQLGNLLSKDVSVLGAAKFAFLFTLIWWNWTGAMFYYNRFVSDDSLHRALVFLQMFAIGNMAIFAPQAFGENSAPFILSYFATRLILVIQYVRAAMHNPNARPLTRRYALGFGLGALIWLLSLLIPTPLQYFMWALALAIEFYIPTSQNAQSIIAKFPPDIPHLMERFALITIIVLGESFIKTIDALAGSSANLNGLLFGGMTFLLSVCVWWVYFDDLHHVKLKPVAYATFAFVYGHLPLTMGITALGVGGKKVALLTVSKSLALNYRWLLCGALILIFLSMAIIDASAQEAKANFRLVMRGLTIVALLLVALVAGGLTSFMTVFLITLICVVQVLIEIMFLEPTHGA